MVAGILAGRPRTASWSYRYRVLPQYRRCLGCRPYPGPSRCLQGFPWPSPTSPLALVSVSSGAEETSGGLAEMTAAAVAPAAAAATLVPRKGKGVATDAPAADGGGAAGKGGGGGADRASYRNPAEALLALAVTESLLAAGDISSAAILTPYRGQVRQ